MTVDQEPCRVAEGTHWQGIHAVEYDNCMAICNLMSRGTTLGPELAMVGRETARLMSGEAAKIHSTKWESEQRIIPMFVFHET
ncbi:hypothetical protein P4O66_019381 [Electrophorus voltai]|uniref:Uncharacterized protein n=1 Tax=Electrophorus voltai TaxID=2609070 RepID=A0AAD8ZTC8_9TELE|nr:hypothetical protein P4O66_019381 [Electrophorus voltai]